MNPWPPLRGRLKNSLETKGRLEMAIQQEATNRRQVAAPANEARWLHVKVVDTSGTGRPVDVKVPIRLVKWGMKMARTFSPELKDANLDWDAITAMIAEGGQGEIVHVEDPEKHQTVDVWTE